MLPHSCGKSFLFCTHGMLMVRLGFMGTFFCAGWLVGVLDWHIGYPGSNQPAYHLPPPTSICAWNKYYYYYSSDCQDFVRIWMASTWQRLPVARPLGRIYSDNGRWDFTTAWNSWFRLRRGPLVPMWIPMAATILDNTSDATSGQLFGISDYPIEVAHSILNE